MNLRSFNSLYFVNFFENIESEKLGFYFSFFLHLIFLILLIGLPDFFKPSPINIPTVIPIEIINVSETTNIPKKENKNIDKQDETKEIPQQKKFNNVEPTLTEKIKIQPKPEIEKIKIQTKPKREPQQIRDKIEENIKNNKKDIIKLDEKNNEIQEEKFESIPTNKIKPKIKPKPKIYEVTEKDTDKIKPKPENYEVTEKDTDIRIIIKPKPKPVFNIASMLKDLRNDSTLRNEEKIKTIKKGLKINLIFKTIDTLSLYYGQK